MASAASAIAVIFIVLAWLTAGAVAQGVRAGDVPALDVKDLNVIPFAFIAVSLTWSVLLAVRGSFLHFSLMLLWGMGFVATVWFLSSFPGFAPVGVAFALVGITSVVVMSLPRRPFWLAIVAPAAAAFVAIVGDGASDRALSSTAMFSDTTMIAAFVAATGCAHFIATWQAYCTFAFVEMQESGDAGLRGGVFDTSVRAVGAQVTFAVDAFRGLSRFDMLA